MIRPTFRHLLTLVSALLLAAPAAAFDLPWGHGKDAAPALPPTR